MFNFRSKYGRHIVTYNSKKYVFASSAEAWQFIAKKQKEMGQC